MEGRVAAAAEPGGKSIAWVKGHSGVMGIVLADPRAKKDGWECRGVATAGGIKHEFRVTWESK